jgi:hypothetical protein
MRGYILGAAMGVVLWALIIGAICSCTQRFPIGNGAYIQNIKIESRECSNFNGVKLCPKENI